ncbi:copper-binding protein [Coralloluteibacterium stylophorae]|uniref:Copper-binding protein n=1 Tax=Coralloluteibacterium stylophorae TaxID=1776034 RepID=A0A8J7VXY8_9GAMM|nr:copper-binding protein [Coralloluteibacterium stylophorae]MBS7457901.1 copper-binding protein [Coralloluteibacterium stylophorae]
MKTATALLSLGLLAACSSPTDEQAAAQTTATDPAAPASPAATAAKSASANGVVEAVDTAAETITIAHGPVPELEWPAMTMTFQASDVDLTAIRQGDRVSFEFTSSGMDGTITAIARQ